MMVLLLLRRTMLLCILSLFSTLAVADISGNSPGRIADLLLREYALESLTNAKTGVIYDGKVPANLTGVKISALRLRTGSLRIKGVKYNEFQIPVGVDEVPYVERIVLVYQNLGNWSSHFYQLDGYIHLTPVLGLLAYNGTDANVSATSLPELDFRSSENPISVKFTDPKPAPEGYVPLCVRFDLHGLVTFRKVILGNTCLTYNQGHFSIVASSESSAPVAEPEPGLHDGQGWYSTELIVVGCAVGGLVLVMLLSFVILCALRWHHKKKIMSVEQTSESGESLKMTCVGTSRVS